jgi:hypothetical protein
MAATLLMSKSGVFESLGTLDHQSLCVLDVVQTDIHNGIMNSNEHGVQSLTQYATG